MTQFRRRVLTVHQSPMNPQRWLITLDCHHESWITAKRRPTRKMLICEACKAKTRPNLREAQL